MGLFTWLIPGESAKQQNSMTNTPAPTDPNGFRTAEEDKSSPPVARIVRVKADMNGQRMDIYGYITNESQEPLTLWRFRLGDADRNLQGSNLSLGENQETLLYSGPPLTSQPRGDAELVYRTSTGDNFLAYHRIRGRMEQGMFILTDLNLRLPIRDVQ